MRRHKIHTMRSLWRRFLYALQSLHTSVTTLWTLGLISDTSLMLDKNVMEDRYDSAERSGRVSSHTMPLIILGRCGAGKTSLSLTLRDQAMPESEGPPKTLGLEETLVEVSYVDMSWRDFGRRFLEKMDNSEFVRALLFFVAADLGQQRLQLKSDFRIGQVKALMMQAVLFLFLITLAVLLKVTLPFSILLLICCGFHALVNRCHNIHFIMGYGTAVTAACFNVVFAQNYSSELEISCRARQLLTVTLLTYVCELFLGLGTGAGMASALCLFYPKKTNESTNTSITSVVLFMVVSHITALLKSPKRSALINLAWIGFSMLACLFVHRHELLFYSLLGLLIGNVFTFGLQCGHKLAPKLSIGGSRNVILTDAIGFVAGCFIAQGFGWSLTDHSATSITFSIALFTFSVYMHWGYVKAVRSENHRVPVLQSLLDSSANPRKPARIAIIDCAGDEVYRDAQHVYMTPLSNYIVVFRATDVDEDNTDCDATYYDVCQWLNSISAHIESSVPRVYLVATHKASPSRNDCDRLARLEALQKRLRRHFSHLLMPVSGSDGESEVIFQIENRFRDDNDQHLQLLRQSIVQHARAQEVPLVWFHFLDIVRGDVRCDQLTGPLPHVESLFDLVQHKCELRSFEEFKQMLQYFNDCGEIFFDSHDAQLSSYVLLDREILSDIVRHLMHTASAGERQETPKVYFDSDELKERLGHLVPADSFGRLLSFLDALNFVVPVDRASSASSCLSFWVPFNLAACDAQVEEGLESLPLLCSAEFDFRPFHPSPLFLRLLSLCERLRTGDEESQLFRNAARFSLDRLRCVMRLSRASPHAISVRLYGAEGRRCAAAVLHQLTCLVRHLCASHFRSLDFSLRLECHSCCEPRQLLRCGPEAFPFRLPDRHRCRCGAEWLRLGRVRAPHLVVASGHVISFRFATDVLLLSHEAPPPQLLAILERVTEGEERRPLQLWAGAEAEGQCCAAVTADAQLQEARAAVVLVSAASNACPACELKVEALWKRMIQQEDFRVIPIVTESARSPALLRRLRSLPGSWEEDGGDRLQNALRRAFEAL